MVGTAFARAIPFHTISLILTSLYTPDDFGELTLFTSFTAMFVVVASHRYEIAIDPLAQRYQNFPRYNAPHTLIDSITNNGINFFIDFLLGIVVTRFYGFTFWLLKVPSLLISVAVYQVFYQRAVEMYNKRESIRPQLLRVYGQLFLFCCLIIS